MQFEKIEDRMDALEDKMAEIAERDGRLFFVHSGYIEPWPILRVSS